MQRLRQFAEFANFSAAGACRPELGKVGAKSAAWTTFCLHPSPSHFISLAIFRHEEFWSQEKSIYYVSKWILLKPHLVDSDIVTALLMLLVASWQGLDIDLTKGSRPTWKKLFSSTCWTPTHRVGCKERKKFHLKLFLNVFFAFVAMCSTFFVLKKKLGLGHCPPPG